MHSEYYDSHGLNNAGLQTIYQSTVVSKLLYMPRLHGVASSQQLTVRLSLTHLCGVVNAAAYVRQI